MVACSLFDAPGETLSKAPVGGSCREEDTNFSNPYSNLFKPYILPSEKSYLLSECKEVVQSF